MDTRKHGKSGQFWLVQCVQSTQIPLQIIARDIRRLCLLRYGTSAYKFWVMYVNFNDVTNPAFLRLCFRGSAVL